MKKFYHTLRLSFIIILFVNIRPASAQLVINSGLNPQQLVQSLLGIGVTASNITFTGTLSATAGFVDPSNSFNMTNGILLTTGDASLAPGPNLITSNGVDNTLPGDSLLNLITFPDTTQDATILEFDFVPENDSLVFNFVFASEEYNEFVSSGYNDAFGFFISGPGFSGVQNIALVPGTTTPVSIDSINNGNSPAGIPPTGPCVNCQYFVANDSGLVLEFDAYTTSLLAGVRVIPCATYHIRLAIADVGDGLYDSGVFLEAGSFKSTSDFNITYNGSTSSSFIGLCPGECATLTAPNLLNYNWNTGDTTQSITVCQAGQYNVSTSAGTCNASSNNVNVTFFSLPPAPVVYTMNDTMFSSISSASYTYQWFNENGTLLPGETNSWLPLSAPGCFYMKLTSFEGCSVFSDTVCASFVSVDEIASNQLHVSLNGHLAEITLSKPMTGILTLTDATGRLVLSETLQSSSLFSFTTEKFANGLYNISLNTGRQKLSGKLMID